MKKQSASMMSMEAGVHWTVGPDGVDRKESHDCVVRSISFVTQIRYWRVYDAIQYCWGRRHKHGYGQCDWERALRRLGVHYETDEFASTQWRLGDLLTVSQFRHLCNPDELYLVSARTHMMGIRDETINDSGSRFRIKVATRITGFDEKKKFERTASDD